MAAFIDEDMNILHINTFVFNASIENVEYPAVIPNFFCKKWKTFVVMYDGSCTSCFEILSLKSLPVQVSLYW